MSSEKACKLKVVILAIALSLVPVFVFLQTSDARTKRYEEAIHSEPRVKRYEEAIRNDFERMDSSGYKRLKGLLGLANGTRSALRFTTSQVFELADESDYQKARKMVLNLKGFSLDKFSEQAKEKFLEMAQTEGERAYLGDLIPSIEMNSPGILKNLSHNLWLDHPSSTHEAALKIAEQSVQELKILADKDQTRPAILPAPVAGWNNDGYLVYDNDSNLHFFFQHNPFATDWNHMYWGASHS
ncbi:MAG: hypothetical protein D3903_06610 [Candidatus Electrothrix sp. GM3_4]|nr:hypothetical protein [Candidatus Electrothrix sp. GM3_4]